MSIRYFADRDLTLYSAIMQSPDAKAADPVDLADLPYLPPQRRFIIMALVLIFSAFVFCMGVLIYRGLTAIDPRSVIYVNGDESWRGAKVRIEGGPLSKPLTAKLDDYNKYQVPFFLAQGAYMVTIDHKDFHAEKAFNIMTNGSQMQIALPPGNPTTQKSY